MPRGRKRKEEVFDAESILGGFLKGDRYDDTERYRQSVNNIYKKLKPIWLDECKDAVWLLKDEYVQTVAEILYLDDEKQKLLGWKQVQSTIERYRAMDYSLVDSDSIKAILSSIIKNKSARDADRLKAIEMYNNMYSSDGIEGITFINDISKLKNRVDKKGE